MSRFRFLRGLCLRTSSLLGRSQGLGLCQITSMAHLIYWTSVKVEASLKLLDQYLQLLGLMWIPTFLWGLFLLYFIHNLIMRHWPLESCSLNNFSWLLWCGHMPLWCQWSAPHACYSLVSVSRISSLLIWCEARGFCEVSGSTAVSCWDGDDIKEQDIEKPLVQNMRVLYKIMGLFPTY